MRVCHIVRLHLFDFFRIRNGNQNVFSRYTKCLSKNFFNIENVLENFQYQNRIERFVSKRKDRIHVYDGKPVILRLAKITEIDIASDAVQTFFIEFPAVRTEPAAKIENRATCMTARKADERAVHFSWLGGNSRLIKIISCFHDRWTLYKRITSAFGNENRSTSWNRSGCA